MGEPSVLPGVRRTLARRESRDASEGRVRELPGVAERDRQRTTDDRLRDVHHS